MFSAVWFLGGCGPQNVGSLSLGSAERQGAASDGRLRIIAANLTSGNYQTYDPGHGARIIMGINPDITLLQEFNVGDNSSAAIRSWIDDTFGPEFAYSRGLNSSSIPNGIVSRWPIIDAGIWEDVQVGNRDYAWARIDIPGPTDLWAVSVHLLTRNSGVRNEEGAALVRFIQNTIPDADFLTIGGDFNTKNMRESVLSTLSSVVFTGAPYAADLAGVIGTSSSRSKPYDHVFVDDDLLQLQIPTIAGNNSFPGGWVVDTRVYTPIADLAPALVGDSASTNMQHMASVKDFNLGGGSTVPVQSVRMIAPNGGENFTIGTSATITWRSSNMGEVELHFSIDGGLSWVLINTLPTGRTTYNWTIPRTPSTEVLLRVRGRSDPTAVDSTDGAFSIVDDIDPPPPPPPGAEDLIIINEVLANEPGSYIDGEFVELLNIGQTAVNLAGWSLYDNRQQRHIFREQTVLAAGEAIVVFGGLQGIPRNLYNAVPASSGALNLSNSGDTVTLVDARDIEVDVVLYSSSLSGADGVSMTRAIDGDGQSGFVLHTSLDSGLQNSPGQRNDGTDFGVDTTPPGTSVVFINEVLANEPGGNSAAEFIELFNTGTLSADLSGWALADSKLVRHVFPAGTILPAGEAIVVFSGASAMPLELPTAQAASTGQLALSNGGDTISLTNAVGDIVDGLSFNSTLSGTDGVSMNREVDLSASAVFVLHTQISGRMSSAGRRADGTMF